MHLRATAHLPGTGGKFRANGDDCACEEIPAVQPSNSGKHWWIQVAHSGLSTNQCRTALAKAGTVTPEDVVCAGNRDRRGMCIQWFSIPNEKLEYPQALRSAGTQGKMKVRQVLPHAKPVDEVGVERLRWRIRLRGAAANEGWRTATAVLDHLRRTGMPNFVPVSMFGRDGELARFGRLLCEGRRPPLGNGVTPGRCLGAFQQWLFNRWLVARLSDGLLPVLIAGDRVRTRRGEELIIDDPVASKGRCDSWEVTALGPLFGKSLPPAKGEAAAREAALLSELGFSEEQLSRLHGGRRTMRVQPGKPLIDIDGDDLKLTLELPPEAYISVLVDEIIKPGEPVDATPADDVDA